MVLAEPHFAYSSSVNVIFRTSVTVSGPVSELQSGHGQVDLDTHMLHLKPGGGPTFRVRLSSPAAFQFRATIV